MDEPVALIPLVASGGRSTIVAIDLRGHPTHRGLGPQTRAPGPAPLASPG